MIFSGEYCFSPLKVNIKSNGKKSKLKLVEV